MLWIDLCQYHLYAYWLYWYLYTAVIAASSCLWTAHGKYKARKTAMHIPHGVCSCVISNLYMHAVRLLPQTASLWLATCFFAEYENKQSTCAYSHAIVHHTTSLLLQDVSTTTACWSTHLFEFKDPVHTSTRVQIAGKYVASICGYDAQTTGS